MKRPGGVRGGAGSPPRPGSLMNPREAEGRDKRGGVGGGGSPPRRLGGRAELVNELARGGGGAGSPQVGWVGRSELLMKRPGGVRGGRGAPPALIVNESARVVFY